MSLLSYLTCGLLDRDDEEGADDRAPFERIDLRPSSSAKTNGAPAPYGSQTGKRGAAGKAAPRVAARSETGKASIGFEIYEDVSPIRLDDDDELRCNEDVCPIRLDDDDDDKPTRGRTRTRTRR
jgi:hypothetical protein